MATVSFKLGNMIKNLTIFEDYKINIEIIFWINCKQKLSTLFKNGYFIRRNFSKFEIFQKRLKRFEKKLKRFMPIPLWLRGFNRGVPKL